VDLRSCSPLRAETMASAPRGYIEGKPRVHQHQPLEPLHGVCVSCTEKKKKEGRKKKAIVHVSM
jgi:hypothetical protein